MPKIGISPNLIGDEDPENYAFVGDIAEVSKKCTLHTKKINAPSKDHIHGGCQHPSLSIYNGDRYYNHVQQQWSDLFHGTLPLYRPPPRPCRIPNFMLHRSWIQQMEKQKTHAHSRIYHIDWWFFSQSKTRWWETAYLRNRTRCDCLLGATIYKIW